MGRQEKTRSGLQALLLVLLIVVSLAGAFAAYFLLYTSSNRARLTQRNFRMLATATRQISVRLDGSVAALEKLKDGNVEALKDLKDEKQIDRAKKQIDKIKGLKGTACPQKPYEVANTDFLWTNEDDNGVLYLPLPWGDGSGSNAICAKLNLSTVVGNALEKVKGDGIYDDYLLTDQTGRLLARGQDRYWAETTLGELGVSFPTPGSSAASPPPPTAPASQGTAGSPPRPEARKDRPLSPAINGPIEFVHGGERYLLFSQPMRRLGNREVVWSMNGIVRQQEFNAQAREISPTLLSRLILLFVLLLLGWPIVKLLLIGPHEWFTKNDLYVLTIASLASIGLVTALALDSYAYRRAEAGLDHGLKEISDQIKQEFRNEVVKAHQVLVDLKKSLPKPQEPLTLERVQEYSDFSDLIWVDEDGRMQGRWELDEKKRKLKRTYPPQPVVDANASSLHLGDRRYFKDAQRHRWSFSEGQEISFAAQPVQSRLTGEQTFVLAIPLSDEKSKKRPQVALIAASLASLIDPLLPLGYGFAVVDNEGEVQLHRNEHINGLENILDECGNDYRLQAALKTRRELSQDVTYYGRSYRFHLEPLPSTPWSLIVFRTNEPLQTANSAVLLVWIVLFGLYLVGPALFLLALKVGTGRYRAEWLWPQRGATGVYAVAALALFLSSVVLFGSIEHATSISRLRLLVAVPILSGSFLFLLLAPAERHGPRWLAGVGFIVASAGVVLSASTDTGWGVALAVGAVGSCAFSIGFSRWSPPEPKGRDNEMSFRVAYASLVTSVCVMVAVGPATLLFGDAFEQGMVAFVRGGQLRHLESMIERRIKRDREGADPGLYQISLYGKGSADDAVAPEGRSNASYLSGKIFPLVPPYSPAVGRMSLLVKSAASQDLLSELVDSAANRTPEEPWGARMLLSTVTNPTRPLEPQTSWAQIPALFPPTLSRQFLLVTLAFAIAIALIGFLIGAIIRRIFLLDADVEIDPHSGAKNGAPELATWVDARAGTPRTGEPTVKVVDLSKLAQPSDCDALFTGADVATAGPAPDVVIVARFDSRLDNLDWTRAKLSLVERLQFGPRDAANDARDDAKVSIVLLSAIDQLRFWSAQPKQGAAADARAVTPDDAHIGRWTEVMAGFTSSDWVYLRNSEPYFAEVLGETLGPRVAEASLEVATRYNSSAGYQSIWSTCTPEEKLAVVHLAAEGFFNPGSVDAVTQLMHRGIVVRDPALRFADTNFATFVLRAKNDPALTAWQQAAPPSSWQTLRTPVLILLAVGAAFLYTTQRGVWDSTYGLITTIGASLPVVYKLLGMFGRGDGASAKSIETKTSSPEAG